MASRSLKQLADLDAYAPPFEWEPTPEQIDAETEVDDGWTTLLVRQLDLTAYEHLTGKHDQKAHGRKGSGRSAPSEEFKKVAREWTTGSPVDPIQRLAGQAVKEGRMAAGGTGDDVATIMNGIHDGEEHDVLYRGASYDDDRWAQRSTEYEIGDEIDLPVISTSKDRTVAIEFQDLGVRRNQVMWTIRNAKGVDITSHAIPEFTWQKEVLTGGRFRVVSRKEGKRAIDFNTIDIELEQIEIFPRWEVGNDGNWVQA